MDCHITHTIAEIGQETWDALSGGRPFASYRWYCFGETVLAHDVPLYILLTERGEPLARAAFWLRREEPLPVRSRPLRGLLEAMLRRWPLLVCRAPLASTSALILPADPPRRDAALRMIWDAAWSFARQQRASFLLFDYLEAEQVRWPGWPSGLATATMQEAGTCLSITWPDFESYLRQLPQSVRKDYRRHRNRAADLGIVVRDRPTVTAVDEALALIRRVERHHGAAPNPWARGMLEHADMVEATWLSAEIAERLVGCGLILGDGGVWALALVGLDYEVQYAYFQLVYAALRCTIEKGGRLLRGGTGVYDIKLRLGFRLEEDTHVLFAGRGPLFRSLSRWAAKMEG